MITLVWSLSQQRYHKQQQQQNQSLQNIFMNHYLTLLINGDKNFRTLKFFRFPIFSAKASGTT